jgi:DNA helicase-2/ATP-dependent DNA helicase PcrA
MVEADVRSPTAEQLAIIAEEERLLVAVREAITQAARGRSRVHDVRAGALSSLRDDYAEAGEDDRPAVLAQMEQAAARMEAARPELLPDPAAPYFARMRLVAQGKRRDVLLGPRPFLDARRGATIVEWRKAPIAEVFFACDPGDPYEIEANGRVIEGVLERRHLVTFAEGALSTISVEGGKLARIDGHWAFFPGSVAPELATEDGQKSRQSGPIELDAQQRALLDRDAHAPLVVLGSAGCGKTTVALHRVAMLCKKGPGSFAPGRVLVLVPEPGLRRLSERILGELGVEGVVVSTFDDWIRAEARRVFPWLPARESPDPPFAASRMKRHPALFAAIDAVVDDIARRAAHRMDRLLAGRGAIREAIDARREPILADRLALAEKALAGSVNEARFRLVAEGFREERRKLERVKGDHRRLVGDRALLDLAVRASSGELSAALVAQVTEHTNRQLEEPSEVRFAHVDADRLVTLDGRSLDDGTPEATAGTVDVEDYALLFELLFRKTGRSGTRAGKLSRYAHVVLDEAQELAPVELGVIGRAVDEGGSVTVAGDAAQRIDRTGHFTSWEAVMEALGVRSTPALLETSYRSPRPVLEFAHAVLGPQAPETMPRAVKEGAPVVRSVVPSEGHAAAILCESLRRLRDREPEAQIAIIAREAACARALHEALSRALTVRLVLDGDFTFTPGIDVTFVAQVKGLEFDHVIVPDATAAVYPDTPESRRMLHVAATRASRRLWVISPGPRSPILPRD